MTEQKKMISIRVDVGLLKLLDDVAAEKDSYYFDRNRTWLIETAIREMYAKWLMMQQMKATTE